MVRLRPNAGPDLHEQIRRWHEAAVIPQPQRVQEAGDLLTVLALVAAGVGVAVVPASAAAVAPPGVEIHPIHHPTAGWSTALTWLPARCSALDRFVTPPGGREG